MAEITPRRKAAFAASALATLAALAAGLLVPTADRTLTTDAGTYPSHLRVGTAPAGASGELVEVVAPSPSWSALGMDPAGWGAVARICAVIPDGGADEEYSAILEAQGVRAMPGEIEVDCPTGSPALEIWDARDPEAPLRCACGPRVQDPLSSCVVTIPASPLHAAELRPARVGEYLPPGSWTGDCPRRLCYESAAPGQPPAGYSMPAGCKR